MSNWHWHTILEALQDRPHRVGAEVGVFRGVFARKLLTLLPDITKYYCIDPWAAYEDNVSTLVPSSMQLKVAPSEAYNIFKEATKPFEDKIVTIRKMSQDALVDVPDASLDWVFIDANHAYEYAKPDILGWSKKVKPGGLLAGHDYNDHQPGRRTIPFGVQRAVRELISDYKVSRNVWYTFSQPKEIK